MGRFLPRERNFCSSCAVKKRLEFELWAAWTLSVPYKLIDHKKYCRLIELFFGSYVFTHFRTEGIRWIFFVVIFHSLDGVEVLIGRSVVVLKWLQQSSQFKLCSFLISLSSGQTCEGRALFSACWLVISAWFDGFWICGGRREQMRGRRELRCPFLDLFGLFLSLLPPATSKVFRCFREKTPPFFEDFKPIYITNNWQLKKVFEHVFSVNSAFAFETDIRLILIFVSITN